MLVYLYRRVSQPRRSWRDLLHSLPFLCSLSRCSFAGVDSLPQRRRMRSQGPIPPRCRHITETTVSVYCNAINAMHRISATSTFTRLEQLQSLPPFLASSSTLLNRKSYRSNKRRLKMPSAPYFAISTVTRVRTFDTPLELGIRKRKARSCCSAHACTSFPAKYT
jgi:hypothetical protein